MLARLAPTQAMSKSQNTEKPEFDLERFKRQVDLGANYEEQAIDLLISRFGERITRRVLVGMYQNGKTFEQSCVDFVLACMNVACDDSYALLGESLEAKNKDRSSD